MNQMNNSAFARLQYCIKQFIPKEATLRRNLLKTSAWRDLEAQADLQRQAGEKESSKQVMFADVYSRALASKDLMAECHVKYDEYMAERIEYFSALGRALEKEHLANNSAIKMLRPLRVHVAEYEASDVILF